MERNKKRSGGDLLVKNIKNTPYTRLITIINAFNRDVSARCSGTLVRYYIAPPFYVCSHWYSVYNSSSSSQIYLFIFLF